jgi:hypothetical protein
MTTHANDDLRDTSPEPPLPDGIAQGDRGDGLTDDERVSREEQPQGQGARVTPGPGDAERLPKT